MANETPSPQPTPEQLAKMQRLIVIALVPPAIVALVLTLLQRWPATVAIEWVSDAEGTYSVKFAVFCTMMLFYVVEIAALIPVAIVLQIVRRLRKT